MIDSDDARKILKEMGPPSLPDPDDISDKYFELIYAVGKKYPGETRHQTALRYIMHAEKDNGCSVTEATDGLAAKNR